MADQQPGTDVAVVDTVDAEIVETSKPFSVQQAQAHDKKIRQQGEKAQQSIDKYLCLIEEAIERQIHVGLGINGLRRYFDTLPKIEITDPDERKAFVSILNGKGLSQRQIAAFTGTSPATVNRDVAAAGVSDETSEPESEQPDNVVPINGKRTTGRDGKSYPAKRKPATRKPNYPKLVDNAVNELTGLTQTLRAIDKVDGAKHEQAEQFLADLAVFNKPATRLLRMLKQMLKRAGEDDEAAKPDPGQEEPQHD